MSRPHWVVVGAGSAGCVLAARLSEDGTRDVTLIEAGPALEADAVPPAISGDDPFAALALDDRVERDLLVVRMPGLAEAPYVRGRGIGGSSAVNAMLSMRGPEAQYRSWGWDDVESAWSRVALPAQTASSDELGPVDRALLAAAADAVPAPLTRRDGRRVTSAEAYLWPASGRPNLQVLTDEEVVEIRLDGGRATGVRLARGTDIPADRVILSAGAIHSPAILQRSGVDVPGVGVHLQDHPSAPIALELNDAETAVGDGLAVGAILDRGPVQILPMNHLGATGPRGFGLLMVALMRPVTSSGTIRWDRDRHRIRVDLDLLRDPRDLTNLRAGVHHAIGLLSSEPFRSIVAAAYLDDAGTKIDALRDDEAIDAWLRSRSGDYVHASSSCGIGRALGDDGRVNGYESLYVCDASAFPAIPWTNPHLPTTMLAERMAARWRTATDR